MKRIALLLLVPAAFVLLLSPGGAFSSTAFVPDDPYYLYDTSRPGFPGQWHLNNTAPATLSFFSLYYRQTYTMMNAGISANLTGAWNLGYTGSGVVIGIVDDGVDGANYDIAPNYRADLSRNFSDNALIANATQGPQSGKNNHGTAVAGVAAARGGNGIGGTGAAPYASIAALRVNLDAATANDPSASQQNYLDAYYWKSGVNPNTGAIEGIAEIQVKNHSYGEDGFDLAGNYASTILALQRTAANGVIHVFSAGNARGNKGEDASKEPVHSTSDVITVAALGSNGKYADYSSYGASVFITAPSNRTDYAGFGITTTDRTGADYGYNRYSVITNPNGDIDDLFSDTGYTSTFGGTSSSAPLVSGIMALGKEANPEMDVRMAKHALVKTSVVVDATDNSASSFGGWRTNGVGNKFNPNYGFGNIDAGAFVQEVRNVVYITEQTSVTKSASFSAAIPDDDADGVSKTITLTAAEADQPLEGVEVGLKLTHERLGDLNATMTSPSGMKSRLFYSTSHLDTSRWETSSVTDLNYTFLTNAFWGESGTGSWILNVADIAEGYTGTWLGYDVTFLMGQMVLLTSGVMTQSVDINAQSLTLLNADTTYQIPSGRTFKVRNNVRVNGGTLIVNGQITEASGAFGNMFSLESGKVGGTGTITASRGFYNNGGNVSPGNSVGTLTINGNYYQGSQGKLSIEIASPTSCDLLAVNGSANLNGTLQTTWTGGYVPALNTNFGTFLTATGGVSGYFSSVLTNITPTIVFQPKYGTANQVYFVVERDYANTTLSSYLSANQRSVGVMLNSVANTDTGTTGDMNTVLSAIDDLPTYGSVASALDQIRPKGQGAMFNMGVQGASYQSGNITGRMEELRSGNRGLSLRGITLAMNNPYDPAAEWTPAGNQGVTAADISALNGLLFSPGQRWGVFASGNYGTGNKRGDDAYSFRTYGATIGADYRFTDSISAGLTLGSYRARTDIDDNGSKANMDHTSLGIYGTYKREGLFTEGHFSYGWNSHDSDRKIVFPGINRTAHSNPRGNQIDGYGGIGNEFIFGKLRAVPSMSLQYVRYKVDSYVESGADSLNLKVEGQTAESVRSKAGGRISYDLAMGAFLLKPSLWTFYTHEFGDETTSATVRLATGGDSCIITDYAAPRRDSFQAGVGIAATGPAGISVYLNYNVHFDFNNYQEHSIGTGIRWEF